MMRRYATPRDANEKEIVQALRAAGVLVTRIESTLDPGVPDLLCEVRDQSLLAARTTLSAALAKLDGIIGDETVEDARDLLAAALRALGKGGRRWVLLEVKTPGKERGANGRSRVRAEDLAAGMYPELVARLGQRRTMNLRYKQADFLATHAAPYAVVETIEEALEACGVAKATEQ